MLISHEVPICLLEKSKSFNDYDYCLLHLTYKYPEYREFYLNSVKEGRKVLLDNSLYELGDALTNEELAKGVMDLKPTEYVVPDCLNDKEVTINRFESFIKEYPNLPGLKIGVCQGKTINEMVECYRYMRDHADKIAIPFGSISYCDFFGFEPIRYRERLEMYSAGRMMLISYLVRNNEWDYTKPHHLLGCNLVKEFKSPLYKELNIESIDTSNPVVAGIEGIRYSRNGLLTKSKIKLNDKINCKLTKKQFEDIIYNTKRFREIIG